MVDYFTDEGTPWARRLWDIGSVLALEELWETGHWQASGVLSSAACDWQRNELRALIGPDRGLGDRELRRELTELLSRPVPEPSPNRRRLHELVGHVRAGYLERWVKAVDVPEDQRVKPERFSRTIAAHLLDLGYSASQLRVWARTLRRDDASTIEVAESAAALARASPRQYEVLVALEKTPRRELAEAVEGWRSKGEVVAWLRAQGHDTRGFRAGGGFIYDVEALDPYAAAEHARQMVERMTARSQFLRRDRGGIVALPHIWVAGHGRPVPLSPPARGADVLSLVNEGHLYQIDDRRGRIEDALELAAVINRGPLAPAVAGGWAAVESLLVHPEDPKGEERSGKAIAADRLAAILACSWPRAELTALAHRHRPRHPDDLRRHMDASTTNVERSRLVAETLRSKGVEGLDFAAAPTRYSDLPAAQRMAELLRNPRPVLRDVSKTYQIALRRFYRARNIVLHGGAVQGVALDAALRIAAPLVGAGLDRLVHAAYVEGLDPLQLAERAELGLMLVHGETALSVVDLLESADARKRRSDQ